MSALAFRATTARPAQLSAPAPRRCAARGAAVRVRAASDLIDTAASTGTHKTLVAAIQAAGLVDTLKSGTFTIFAPTDAAFAALPAGTVDDLLKPANKDKLVDILTCVLGARGALPGRIARRGRLGSARRCEPWDCSAPQLTRPAAAAGARSYHVVKGKNLSKHVANAPSSASRRAAAAASNAKRPLMI